MRSKDKKKFNSEQRLQLIVAACFLCILSLMTVGYAAKSYLFRISGRVDFEIAGGIYISDVQQTAASNLVATATHTGDSINLEIASSVNPSADQSARLLEYLVTVKNTLPIRRCYYEEPLELSYNDANGAPIYDVGAELLALDETGMSPDFQHCIESGAEAKFKIRYAVNNLGEAHQNSQFFASIKYRLRFAGEEEGRIVAHVQNQDLELVSPSDYSTHSITLINTYPTAQTVTLTSELFNHNIILLEKENTDALVLPANSSKTISLRARRSADYPPDRPIYIAPVYVTRSGSDERIEAGNLRVKARFDQSSLDHEAPLITELSHEILDRTDTVSNQDNAGDIKLSWQASDFTAVDYVVVELYRQDATSGSAQLVSSQQVSDLTSYTFSNVAAGNYFYRIWGVDVYGNAGRLDGAVPSKGSGANVYRESELFDATWKWPVSYELTNVKDPGVDFIWRNRFLLVTMWPDGSWKNSTHTQKWGHFPTEDMVTVYMSGRELARSEYSYSKSNGQLRIERVTGPVRVVARAEWCWIGWCDV